MNRRQLSQPELMRRRVIGVFLGSGLLASFASFIYPVLRYLVPPAVADLGGDEVVAAKLSELKPNSGKIFRFGSRPGLLIMNGDGTYRALSATCTHLGCTVQYRNDLREVCHLGCTVQYRNDLREVWCACHNGIYDLNGRNVSGPPPRPLDVFDVHLRGDEIVVSRKREA
ncbi:quinol--cytochrome-c reductase, Rieske (2Fe-2S) iron-sulfur subunit [Candidatus Sulfotelmatobacter kueseliae]|uniref:Quinol--cytochrome-c reductase, Rieske (2Fe-2S) iron-sulfur subunit n=1 Tax=Candidatus Sulfotelmatobacter kueseliae TaxID=2042962 RepID=A0A2U3KUS0_9BACT|nr:quinol--cytochrome-c reductase, Rieske (2Fe-2S) iron-sulfur subunit [Candidatus Sulfotelmatobacter kueseliae]